jgi:hypothetical protein
MADEIKPVDGKTTIDDKVMFEAQRLSYDAARVVAEKIAQRISQRTKEKEVVIAGTQFLADMSNLVATKAILEELAKDYALLAEAAPSARATLATRSFTRGIVAITSTLNPVVGAVTVGVQTALTLVSLFRQDVDYKGVPISIDTLAFELELAARLRMHRAREVIVPEFAVFATPSAKDGALITLLERVKGNRTAAIKALAPKPSHPLGHDPKLPTPRKGGDVDDTDLVLFDTHLPDADADSLSIELTHIDARFNDLQTQLMKSDVDPSGLTILARLLRIETIVARSPILVHVRVVLAGGSNRVQHSLWSSMFHGDGLSSRGGAVVTWAILNVNGAVEDGGVFSHSMSAASPKPPETPPSIS